MSALFAISAQPGDQTGELSTIIRASFRRQGFAAHREFAWNGGMLCWFETPGNPGSREQWQDTEGGFISCVGTLFYRGRHGAAALRELWSDFVDPGTLSRDSLFGNYVVALAKAGKTWLFGDRLGMVRLFRAPRAGVVSTSWLACLATVERAKLDRIGSLDYVLSGSNHGTNTPVDGIENFDPSLAIELGAQSTTVVSRPQEWSNEPPPSRFDAAVVSVGSLLVSRGASIHSAFGERIRCALSGGFDSRLILSALLAAGSRPAMHVYGRDSDDDVRIATRIASQLSLAIQHTDKAIDDAGRPQLTAEAVEQRCQFFDGIPTDGIFDRGSDQSTRIEQSANGNVALNGGGGEILRNFFYLRDGTFTAAQLVQTFYTPFSHRVFRRRGDASDYADHLEEAIHAQLGTRGGRLSREQIELIYPLFRARFWTSRNTSLAVRAGHFLTPLLDPMLIPLAAALPLAWKDYGRLESAVIGWLNPELARHPLVYGFSPSTGPTAGYRLKMWLQHRRPPWMRARSYAWQALLGMRPPPSIDPTHRALFSGPLEVESLVELNSLADEMQLLRALTLEFLIRNHGVNADL